jgi:hypothetical protein
MQTFLNASNFKSWKDKNDLNSVTSEGQLFPKELSIYAIHDVWLPFVILGCKRTKDHIEYWISRKPCMHLKRMNCAGHSLVFSLRSTFKKNTSLKSFSQSVRDAEFCCMNSPENFIGLKHWLPNRRSCPLGYTTAFLEQPRRILGRADPLLGNDRK